MLSGYNMAAEDDSDIPDTGAVFTFGKSKFADNLPSKFWVKNDKVLNVACGDEHTAIVNETGRVFTFGSNDWGQLGLDHTKPTYKPACVKKLKHEKCMLVACGRVHTIVATESGKLYSFGANSEGQLGVENCSSSNEPKEITGISSHKYTQLSAGADHSAALTDDGEVYVWGGGSEGQLGLGDETECPQPQLLDIEGKVTCLSCGYYHTAIVTDSGELYTFGESDGGKLGLGDEDVKAFSPTKVDLPEKAKYVACGNTHTVVLLESGKVFSFGDGNNGQLGHGTRVLQSSLPKQIYCKQKIKVLSCGDSHTALITEKGQLLTFGDGRHGKLGQDQENTCNIYVPMLVEHFSNFHVDQVSCGGCHMLAVGIKRLQVDVEESSEDEIEDVSEVVNKNLLNASLKADGSLDLNNSFTAREKRRQNTLSKSPSIIKRQLPELNNNKPVPLSATLPPNETPLAKERIHGVQSEKKIELHRTVGTEEKQKKEEGSQEESEEETDKNVNQNIDKTERKRKQLEKVSKQESEEEEEESEEDEKPTPTEVSESRIAKPTDSEDEASEEETKFKPTPTKRGLPKRLDQSTDSEVEEEIIATRSAATRELPTMPVPQPRKANEEKVEDEESEEEHKEKLLKKKGKNKEKKSTAKIFGKSTGLSDDDEEDQDLEKKDDDEDKTIKKNDKEDKKSKKDKKKGKDKKKEKKGKKDKNGKKDKDGEEAENEEGDSKAEEKENDKKKKKERDKMKDKKKNKNEDEDTEKDEDVMEKVEETKPASQKKSGLCTIL